MDFIEDFNTLCVSDVSCEAGTSEACENHGAVCEEDFADDMTCAICLEQIPVLEMAIIKGCEHLYCAHCILQWSLCKDNAWCPQCKKPFSYLYTHRQLDGTITDYPVEESLCLLKRATWFVDHMKVIEKGKAPVCVAEIDEMHTTGPDWFDFYDDYDDEDEDEEIENYYFSSAAGAARIVLGNRRWGENGYVRGGRQHARPVPQRNPHTGKPKGKSKGGSSSVAGAGATASGAAGGSSSAADAGATASSATASGAGTSDNTSTPGGSAASPSSGSSAATGTSATAIDTAATATPASPPLSRTSSVGFGANNTAPSSSPKMNSVVGGTSTHGTVGFGAKAATTAAAGSSPKAKNGGAGAGGAAGGGRRAKRAAKRAVVGMDDEYDYYDY